MRDDQHVALQAAAMRGDEQGFLLALDVAAKQGASSAAGDAQDARARAGPERAQEQEAGSATAAA